MQHHWCHGNSVVSFLLIVLVIILHFLWKEWGILQFTSGLPVQVQLHNVKVFKFLVWFRLHDMNHRKAELVLVWGSVASPTIGTYYRLSELAVSQIPYGRGWKLLMYRLAFKAMTVVGVDIGLPSQIQWEGLCAVGLFLCLGGRGGENGNGRSSKWA